MPTFLISKLASQPKADAAGGLDKAISSKLSADKRIQLNDSDWFVNFDGTSRELSLLIGAQGGGLGGVLIAEVSSISGYGPSRISSWFKANTANGERNDK